MAPPSDAITEILDFANLPPAAWVRQPQEANTGGCKQRAGTFGQSWSRDRKSAAVKHF
jgi:hypothetical protein